jgi:RNA polymerase sigma-70 factor (ECF subfamily)
LNQEGELVEKSLRGDMKSFETLVNLYKDKMYCFLFKMTLSKEDSDDLLQETFICVFKNLYKYNDKWKFSTWIYKIATNLLKNYWKKKEKLHTRELSQFPLDDLYSDFNNPEIKYENKESYLQIVKILNELDYNYKIVFVLKYVKDFSIADIANITGVSPENVKMRIYRTRKKICKEFKKYEM